MANDNARQIVAPPTPMKITQIAVVVRDIEAALKTYTQTLGWGSTGACRAGWPGCSGLPMAAR